MVYAFNPCRMNCDRLFNLFCLYGNVIKVSNFYRCLNLKMILLLKIFARSENF